MKLEQIGLSAAVRLETARVRARRSGCIGSRLSEDTSVVITIKLCCEAVLR